MTFGSRLWQLRFTLIAVGVAAPSYAQTGDFLAREAARAAIVEGVPYAAEGRTTIRQTLADGTHIDRTLVAKFYRDSAGRVRREQTIAGLEALGASAEPHRLVVITDPVANTMFVLDPAKRVARRLLFRKSSLARTPPPPPPPPPPAGVTADEGSTPPPPLPAPPRARGESLGVRHIDGLEAIGRRTRLDIAVGKIGNDRPIQITDERWESKELKVVLLSRYHDPRTGDVDYRLTNVVRGEPAAELFVVPAGYTISDVPLPPPPPPPRP
jgi:hypothetical protein